MNDPNYHPVGYRWRDAYGDQYLPIDGKDVVHVKPTEDGSAVVVLQSHDVFGSDNVVILGDRQQLIRRVANPYRHFKDFRKGDEFYFYGILVEPSSVTLHIQVHRKLPNYEHDALPVYEAHYAVPAWSLLGMQWHPWT
ncbi:MAG: hypothetical protein QM666_03190 [Acinetobacter sp.]